MKKGCEKYIPFEPVKMASRDWPDKMITKAPIWCSVDLRDGNQALVDPMNLAEKLEMFQLLCDIGIKEIEVGFPSASDTEYEILRALIDGGHIPPDVTVQVLVQAREHLIRKTFDAIEGAKNVIVHFYNSTSKLQRKVVFGKDMDGIIDIAVEGARLIRALGEEAAARTGANIRYEYSPESFMGTEPENAVAVCQRVIEAIGADAQHKIILNLPSTVESSTPNLFADQVEYFCKNLPSREAAIISLHPHNDRGTAVATAELGMLAGAERVEGTLFGNGERTGNVDIITLALNMFTQAVDPKLDFSNIGRVREVYERTTKMQVPVRHPYVGDLVFTAFSGSHQDAINKGEKYMKDSGTEYWEVPYLPIDPADVGREYEPVIRINSQSGKGGAAFVMNKNFGYDLPKAMHPEFGRIVKNYCDRVGREISADEVMELFRKEYIDIAGPYSLVSHKFFEEGEIDDAAPVVRFEGMIKNNGAEPVAITGKGNGPIDSFFNALAGVGIKGYSFVNYSEHAISIGSDAKAVSYIQLASPEGKNLFGVGISHNINYASIKGILCAINRSLAADKN
ncbi:MAG TPA: 2-isopropylmalate synthase [Clostridiales bacterium]|nr:MAG: 2-isopropylmalate synthase [Firmicutes bacterium ADurb.Bin262]HOU11348.1 2-isopropylmalate synthase [Clostridiales bacterium]HQK74522.1 2-isopropylmalate synthase [Clostridiales bacterium]